MNQNNKQVVLAHGTFDLLHPGHVAYLEFARSHGDTLLVALSSDEMTRRRKGAGRPIQSFHHRKAVVESVRFVDSCFEAPTTEAQDGNMLICIKTVQPNVFVTSYEEFETKYAAFFKEMGIRLIIAPRFGESATTEIVKKIAKRYGKNTA